jgi:hypothetical protein
LSELTCKFSANPPQQCVGILMAFEHRLKAEPAATEADLLGLLAMAKDDFRGSGDKTTTLLEVRLKQSLDQVEKANGAGGQELVSRSRAEFPKPS